MSRKPKPPYNPMDRYKYLFDVETVTREELVEQLRFWGPPYGSYGGTPHHMCGLLHQIAILKGFNITPDEVDKMKGMM